MLAFLTALLDVWLELAPWLLLGTLVAALIHGILPRGWIHRHLGGRFSVLKAVALGVPLPLCSCGVIPTGLGLKRDGASDGASIGFIVATPQTGVDSTLVAASFLGWPFALFKIVAALITGLTAGLLTDAFNRLDTPPPHPPADEGPRTLRQRASAMIDHGGELLRSIWRWILFGVVASAAITTFVPDDALASLSAGGGLVGMGAALLVALPLYVCATASVPIAAALVTAGMPTGAALVFLMAGPATNVATIGALYRAFGLRTTAIYLATIIVASITMGLGFDAVLPDAAALTQQLGHHDHHTWWAIAAGVVLAALMLRFAFDDLRALVSRLRAARAPQAAPTLTLDVTGMSCAKCAGKLHRALTDVPGVRDVVVDLDPGRVTIHGTPDRANVLKTIRDTGFTPAP